MKQPTGILEGLSLNLYRAGHVYDVPPTLAAYLVAEGFAEVEMRGDDQKVPPPALDRRHK